MTYILRIRTDICPGYGNLLQKMHLKKTLYEGEDRLDYFKLKPLGVYGINHEETSTKALSCR